MTADVWDFCLLPPIQFLDKRGGWVPAPLRLHRSAAPDRQALWEQDLPPKRPALLARIAGFSQRSESLRPCYATCAWRCATSARVRGISVRP